MKGTLTDFPPYASLNLPNPGAPGSLYFRQVVPNNINHGAQSDPGDPSCKVFNYLMTWYKILISMTFVLKTV